jgi:adenosylhomocysteine nucleosidase
MESAVIHEACAARGIPCATVRSISDLAEEDLPLDFNRLATPRQTLSPWRLAMAVLRSPGCLPGLLKLGRHSAAASRSLGALLERVLAAP